MRDGARMGLPRERGCGKVGGRSVCAGGEQAKDMETAETGHGSTGRVRQVAHRRDLTYQFPVYRWLSWLVIAGYVIGLGAMYLVAGMFGLPAPLAWAFLVVVFLAGISLLDRPRALMNAMMFYILLMPGNRLLGLLGLPLPGFIDELLFLPPIAVIVMNLVQGRSVKGGNWFPLLFGLVAVLSWYVNGKGGLPTMVKILLVNFKFFIIWYFCRLTLTFKDTKELFRWCWLFIGFAALQFAYNTLWQRAPWPRFHPDRSGGVFGPDAFAAHIVGYISSIALFLLAGWSVTRYGRLSGRKKFGVWLVAAVLLYDLVFMTDTKHVLMLMPLACAGLLFLPGLSGKIKLRIGMLGVSIALLGAVYFNSQDITNLRPFLDNFWQNPKGRMFQAVTRDFHCLVRYPMFGAGPGKFASEQAREARMPLARIYITPYADEEIRRGFFGLQGTTVASSILGSLNTDFFFIISEFGWLGEAIYIAFWGWCVMFLLRKGGQFRKAGADGWGVFVGLGISLFLIVMLQLLTTVCTVGCLAFPLWMLVGRIWDMPVPPGEFLREHESDDAGGEGAHGTGHAG